MNYTQLLTPIRYGKEHLLKLEAEGVRSEFQRDYDRLIFSSPFRRLQNKTQVFPLPGSVFVHNRLTHSLEVASVGRSLGNIVAQRLKIIYPDVAAELFDEIGTIVSTASLSHDLGNPPFGHAGEKAISAFFKDEEGKKYKEKVSLAEWHDLTNFEGNANALRLLTHQFNGRRKGGFALTYATLASLIKYPFASVNRTKKNKYGFFNSEKETFKAIAKVVGLKALDEKKETYVRHPLVYLVEAADDISYQIMDIEDAHKLKILGTVETIKIMMQFFHPEKDAWFYKKKNEIFNDVSDTNEQIAFLRASVINLLIHKMADVFINNEQDIINGAFKGSLVDYLSGSYKEAMDSCESIAFKEVYQHRSVIEVEITGYNVLNTLTREFTNAIFNPDTEYSKKLLALLPLQFKGNYKSDYEKLRAVIDFVSGMTDLYALDLYKLIKGIGIK